MESINEHAASAEKLAFDLAQAHAVQMGASVESALASLTAGVIGGPFKWLASGGMSWVQSVKFIQAMAKLMKDERPRMSVEWKALAATSDDLRDRRNDVVHGEWLVGVPDVGNMGFYRKTLRHDMRAVPLSTDALIKLIDELDSHLSEVNRQRWAWHHWTQEESYADWISRIAVLDDHLY